MNLSSIILPVADVRIKLDMGTLTYDAFTDVVILSIGSRNVGMVW